MPIFYFHLRTGAGFERDDIGLELESLEVAYLNACDTVPELMADLARERADPCGCVFEIADATGRILMDVPFSECIGRGRTLNARPGQATTTAESEILFARMDRVMVALRGERRKLQDNILRAQTAACRLIR